MGAGDSFGFFSYASDDGTNYAVKLSVAVAGQGGFTTVVDPLSSKVWPFHSKNLRHVLGKTSDGKRTRLPCQNNSFTLYQSGGSFNLAEGTYNTEGAIGEKRKLNSIG